MQYGRRKRLVMCCIRESLCLKAETGAFLINDTFFSLWNTLNKITCIELNANCIGKDFHTSSAFRFSYFRNLTECSVAVVQYIVVVISAGNLQLLIICLNICSDALCSTKIHRCSLNRKDLSSWDHALSYRCECICIQP